MSDHHDYAYSQIIEPGTIRLIQLQPSQDLEAPLRCSLTHTTLERFEDSPLDFYIALSYVWGDASSEAAIIVDGQRLSITASLDLALRHLREEELTLNIWADGICINQKDNDDRNLQVSQMGAIYSTAQHTIIFLGPSSPVCEGVLQSLKPTTFSFSLSSLGQEEDSVNLVDDSPLLSASSLSRVSSASVLSLDSSEQALDQQILSRSWFSRSWVFQELILSQDPWIQIGRTRIKWLHLSRRILSVHDFQRSKNFSRVARMAEARTEIRRSKEHQKSENPAKLLLDVLSIRRGLGVTKPQDMIFAHLGMLDMSTEVHQYQYYSNTLHNRVSHENLIAIDYNKSVVQVYEDVAKFISQNLPDLPILAHIEIGDEKRRTGLPSWVPDWTREWNSADIPYKARRAERRAYARSSGDPAGELIEACRDIPPLFPSAGILAVYGEYEGSIKSILKGSKLPKIKDPGRTSSGMLKYATSSEIINWVTHSADIASETLKIFLDYHISMSRNVLYRRDEAVVKSNRLDEKTFPNNTFDRSYAEADWTFHETTGLGALFRPLVEDWISQLSNDSLLTDWEISPEWHLAEKLTNILWFHIGHAIAQFNYHPASNSGHNIALTSLGRCVPVPISTCINDILATILFSNTENTFVLRPEPGNWVELDDTIRHDLLYPTGSNKFESYKNMIEIKHCRYVGRYSEVVVNGCLFTVPDTWASYREALHLPVIFALH